MTRASERAYLGLKTPSELLGSNPWVRPRRGAGLAACVIQCGGPLQYCGMRSLTHASGGCRRGGVRQGRGGVRSAMV